MKGKSGFTNRIAYRGFGNVLPHPDSGLRKPDISSQADVIAVPATDAASPSGVPVPTITKEELLSRAKRNIESCEKSLREAAEDIARAYEQGATQREIALAVGKSAAWVNGLLKWRASGYEGSAFGNNRVQSLNKQDALPAPAATRTTLPVISWVQSGNSSEPEPHISTPGQDGMETAPSEHASSNCEKRANVSDAVPSTTGTIAVDLSVHRQNLIEALDLMASTRPGFRAKLALIVEQRRTALGLTWDQLIVPADAFHLARKEPTS